MTSGDGGGREAALAVSAKHSEIGQPVAEGDEKMFPAEFTISQPRSERHWQSSPHARKEIAVMLCDDVKRVMYFFLDGSLSDQKKQHIEIHLSDCRDCETRVTIHRRLRGFFRRRLAPISAPETLRVRVVQSLRAAQ